MRWALLAALLLVPSLAFAAPQLVDLDACSGTVVSTTKTCGSSAATIVASPTAVCGLIVVNTHASETVNIGDATPDFPLKPGQSLPIPTNDAQKVYCQRAGSVDVTLVLFYVGGL